MRKPVVLVASVAIVLGVVGYAAPAGAGGYCSDGNFSDARGTTVSMRNHCFEPAVIRIQRGDKLTFVNDDAEAHAVGGIMNVFGNMHTEVLPEERISYRFDEDGIFPYVCILHPGMAGAVVVGDGEGNVTGGVAALAPSDVPGNGGGKSAPPRVESGPLEGWIVVAAAAVLGVMGLASFIMGRARSRGTAAPTR